MSGFDPSGNSESPIEIPPEYRDDEYLEEHKSTLELLVESFLENKLRLLSLFVVLGIVVMAVFAPMIALHDPEDTFTLLQEPNSYSMEDVNDDGVDERLWHPLGTDSFGHDIFSRIVFGARISLLVAVATVIGAFVAGTTIGLLAGYFGGWVDNVLMRYVDFQWAFPEIVLAIAIIAYIGGLGVMNVVLAISLAYVDDFARLVRGEVLWIREEEFVKAAHALGMSDRRIMAREILPNAVAPIIVQATVMIPLAIIAEAGLSFLGLGVRPTTPTWGLLIASGRGYITSAWWISVMPGLAIMATVLAFNILGDGLRDALDVREEGIE